jgi:hypothetical protein
MNSIKMAFQRKDSVELAGKRVQIKKLTYVTWKELFETIDTLPGIIVNVILAPKENFYETVLVAFDFALDEVYRVVAILSGLEETYLKENAGINEVAEYLVLTAKKNDFNNVIKNAKSLLPKAKTEPTE